MEQVALARVSDDEPDGDVVMRLVSRWWTNGRERSGACACVRTAAYGRGGNIEIDQEGDDDFMTKT